MATTEKNKYCTLDPKKIFYATEGLSQNMFVSKYRLQLPSEEEMRQYLLDFLRERSGQISGSSAKWIGGVV